MKTSALVFLFSLVASLQSFASNCVCTANPNTKAYTADGVVNTWWGGVRKWSCVYSCESHKNPPVEIRGSHKEKYFGADEGLWGICDGLVYVNEYNAYAERFVWAFSRIGTFDPVKSKSPELKQWAQGNCQ